MPETRPIAVPHFELHDLGWGQQPFVEALLEGLSRPQKAIPCQFLYDQRGSQLFERICALPEYYPTRTETLILRRSAPELATLIGPEAVIYELGSGSSTKTPILLDRLDNPYAYAPIDVSRDHLISAAAHISALYPDLRVEAVCGDFAAPHMLPEIPANGRRVAFFPGSTIGNMAHREAIVLLKHWREHLGAGGMMIVGADLKKDPALLHRAYDDDQGVTAQFILNVLAHANRAAHADFDSGAFRYECRYDDEEGAVRMFLVSRADQEVNIAGHAFYFARDERLHIEDSRKYTNEEFAAIARAAGFPFTHAYTDPHNLFSVQLLSADLE